MAENTFAPLAFTISDAVRASGLARSRLYEEMRAGRIEARKAGRRTLILADSLAAFLAALPIAAMRPEGVTKKDAS